VGPADVMLGHKALVEPRVQWVGPRTLYEGLGDGVVLSHFARRPPLRFGIWPAKLYRVDQVIMNNVEPLGGLSSQQMWMLSR